MKERSIDATNALLYPFPGILFVLTRVQSTKVSKSLNLLAYTPSLISLIGPKKTFMCHCGKIFTQNSSYYMHLKYVHEKLKKHACQLCAKTFFEKYRLRNHIKSQHVRIIQVMFTLIFDEQFFYS